MPESNDEHLAADTDADDRDELAELRALAGRVRPEKVEWEAPPAALWDRIEAEADLDPAELDQTVADLPTLTVPGNSGLDDTGIVQALARDDPEATDPDPDATAVIDTLGLALDETAVFQTLPENLAPTEAFETLPADLIPPEVLAPDAVDATTPPAPDAGGADADQAGADADEAGAIADDDAAPLVPLDADPESEATIFDGGVPPIPLDAAAGTDAIPGGPEAAPFPGTVAPVPPVRLDSEVVSGDTAPPEIVGADPEATAFDGTIPPPAPLDADPDSAVLPAPVAVDPDATAYNPTLPPVPVGDPDETAVNAVLPPSPVDADPDATAVNPTLPPAPADGGIDPLADADGAHPGATVSPIGSAPSRRPGAGGPSVPRWLLVAAAIVAVLVIGGIVRNLTSSDDGNVVATSTLERLGDAGEGRAELIDDDGSFQLRVETRDVDPGDGFLEVWVIDPEVTKLISLGPLRGDGLYTLPKGFDRKAFPIVDVSVEPVDGNPTHSGQSVLRGELKA